jgi:small basic protein (TIGR04137 family)
MGIHPSLKTSDKVKKARSVMKRSERIRSMMEKGQWKEGDDVYRLPKLKTVRIKIKKEKVEKVAEGVAGAEGAAAAPAAGAAKEAAPAKGAAKAADKK